MTEDRDKNKEIRSSTATEGLTAVPLETMLPEGAYQTTNGSNINGARRSTKREKTSHPLSIAVKSLLRAASAAKGSDELEHAVIVDRALPAVAVFHCHR